jgi:hypothetical protein
MDYCTLGGTDFMVGRLRLTAIMRTDVAPGRRS